MPKPIIVTHPVKRRFLRSGKEYPDRVEDYNQEIKARASAFTCSTWHGYPCKYETHHFKNEGEVREYATKHPTERGWMIYAIASDGRFVHLYNIPEVLPPGRKAK